MGELLAAYDALTAQQDFAWFCAAIAWTVLAVLVVQQRRRRAGPSLPIGWLAAAILGGLTVSLAELWLHAAPPVVIYDPERVAGDLVVSAGTILQVGGLLALLLADCRALRERLAAILGSGALAALWLARREFPLEAELVLAATAAALGIAAWTRRPHPALASAPLRRAIVIAAVVPWLANTGPLAAATAQQLRWTELSRFALPFSAGQIVLAATLTAGVWRHTAPFRSALAADELSRELRGLAWIVAGWLALGFVLALATGRMARQQFQESLLARARAAVTLIDAASAERCLGPQFRLVANPPNQQRSGRTNHYVTAPHLLVSGRRTRHDLDRVEQANPDIAWAHLMTIREGWLVSWAFADHLPTRKDAVSLHRPATAEDREAWASQQEFFAGPFISDWGELVRTGAPLRGPDGRMLGWLALDVTAARWAAAQALARLQTFALVGVGLLLALFVTLQRLRRRERELAEQAAQASREAARVQTAFLAKVSHELRTPIQSILGYGELLASLPLGPEPGRWLGGLRSQSQLLIRLVNDLIDLSALQAGAFRLVPKPGHLPELVQVTADSLRPRASAKGLVLVCDIAPDVAPWRRFDAERVRQVLLNLLGNAIKFTACGEVRLQLREAGGAVEIAVSDTGPGIDPEDQARLFQPFSRLEAADAVEGAGLGLALSAAICRSCGGSLQVASDGEHGSTFTAVLALPAVPPPATVSAEAHPASAALAGLRVLVADDNPLVRELFLSCLRGAGAWCESASDGLEAVERCTRERFEVVILDLSMPWLDGFEAARRVRAARPQPPRIIGVSAHAGAGEQQLALAAGMDAFLVKPVPLATLLTAVASVPLAAPETGADLALRQRLRAQFLAEAPRLEEQLRDALASGDRSWLRNRAHYLKNSADVAGYPAISQLCARLHHPADATGSDPSVVVAELCELLAQLRAGRPATFSDTSSEFPAITQPPKSHE